MTNKKKSLSITANLSTQAKKINTEILIASEELVDGTIATGSKAQDLLENALKSGVVLMGKQQTLALDTIEAVLGQYQTGNKRFKKLLGLEQYEAQSVISGVAKKITTIAGEAIGLDSKKKKKAGTKTIKSSQPTSKKATKKAAKRSNKSTKKIAKKATPTNTDLTVIEGIGPKIANLLQKAGIRSFQQLAQTEPATLKAILAKAGSRYTMHDPSTWGQQAELAAAGKWEVLKVWKSRLKGGMSATNKRVVVL